MDVAGMAEGDRTVGVRVAHGWDADTSTPFVLLRLRNDAAGVGIVSLSADLAQILVDQVTAAIAIVRQALALLRGGGNGEVACKRDTIPLDSLTRGDVRMW